MRSAALAVLAAVLAAGAACRPEALVPVSVDIPAPALFPPGSLAAIVVTDFRDEAPRADLRPGRELRDYLAAELGRVFKGTVSLAEAPPAPAAGPADAVILTGAVRIDGHVRKALQSGGAPADSPFRTEGRALVERRRWTLEVDLLIVSAATGETVHRLAIRGARDYIDLDKPVETAFFELADAVRDRLFRVLLGRPSVEKRALLRR